jgi:hypothetical protein
VEDIDFWVNFVDGNWNKLQKLGLEGKKYGLSPQGVGNCANIIGYINLNGWKINIKCIIDNVSWSKGDVVMLIYLRWA